MIEQMIMKSIFSVTAPPSHMVTFWILMEDQGEWKPTAFIGGSDPILRDIKEFQRDVRAIEGGFFNTRKIKPSKISTSDQNVGGSYYHVTDKTFVEQAYPDGIPANAVRWGRL